MDQTDQMHALFQAHRVNDGLRLSAYAVRRLGGYPQNADAFMDRAMRTALGHQKAEITELKHPLLTALAAFSGRAILPEYDQSPKWCNATPQPMD
jgi:hypothetical protein